MVQTLKLYGHAQGPNPWKVAIILEELGVPYEQEFLDFSLLKQEPYESKNPNGRVPALEDPNTGLTLWESGTIIDYLLETYDKENKLNPTEAKAKWAARSWRDFQMSGQGPYFGQGVWFRRFHAEKVPSAVDRYANEVARVIGVIDRHLAKHNYEYLTGSQISYADLMFYPWNTYLSFLLPDGFDIEAKTPHFAKWWAKIQERPAIKAIAAAKEKAIAESNH